MYGDLLRMAYRQARAAHAAPRSTAAAAACLVERRARLAAFDALAEADLVVSHTADVLAYDLALIDSCESLGIPHRLIEVPGPFERLNTEASLKAAGVDIRALLARARDERSGDR